MAEDRGAGVVPVLALQVEFLGQQRVAPGGVDEIAARPAALAPLLVHGLHQRVAALGKLDVRHAHPLDHPGALGGAVPQQQVVELGAAHLVGIGLALVQREGELELVVAADFQFGGEIHAGLPDADGVHLLEHAEAPEDRQVVRQERLADVKARVALLLEHHHVAPALGEQRRHRRPGGSAADHQYFAALLVHDL